MDTRESQQPKPPAVVIGLDNMTGLQTARILARHQIPVIAITSKPDHFCCKTRVCQEILVADTKTNDFIQQLETIGPKLAQKAVLYPCTDLSVLALSQCQDHLSKWFHIALPDPKIVEMLVDKVSFYTYAQQAELPIPPTFFLRNRLEAQKAAERLSFPCILKPPMKTPTWEKNTKAKVFKVKDAAEFLETYDRCASWAELLMAQEWVEGPDSSLYSCNCYFDRRGQPLVTFIARKLRQWPPRTGTSCLGEEVRNDEVLEASLRLFAGVGYHGLGYVEMKQDARTGRSYIIEPNIGRPTGRSAIAEGGGVELLYTMYCDLLGWELPAERVQHYEGVKWIYWRHDIQSALYYLSRGEVTLLDVLRSWRGRKVTAIFSWSDPAPFFFDFFGQVSNALKIKSPVPHKTKARGGVQYR